MIAYRLLSSPFRDERKNLYNIWLRKTRLRIYKRSTFIFYIQMQRDICKMKISEHKYFDFAVRQDT